MTTSPATCWNARRFIGVITKGRRTGQIRRRDNAAEVVERMKVGRRAATFFPLTVSYPLCGD